MSETTTSFSVLVLSALIALAFFASFGGHTVVTTAQIMSWFVFPVVLLAIIAASIALIRYLWMLSQDN